MQNYKVLCALFSAWVIFFYSFTMEKEHPQSSNKEIISLIAIIKTQQNILGYTPSTKALCIPEYFESMFEKLATLDPKENDGKIFVQKVYKEAISCINTIIYEYYLPEDQIHSITECFGINSLPFLRKTIEHNEKLLKKRQLFDAYYQQVVKTHSDLPQQEKLTPPISPRKPKQTQQPQEIIEQFIENSGQKEKKNNQINFTQSTYTGLFYDYQAYIDCQKREIPCDINTPFIKVEIILFSENGSEVSRNPNMPLPLPIFLNDDGTIKEEIFLSLSKRPFIVNNRNVELLQKQLPALAIKFYNNIKKHYNQTYMTYLIADNVIQQQGDAYIHGTNSCRPLLEEYFNLWGIPESDYAQAEPESVEEQQIPHIQNPLIRVMLFARNGIAKTLSNIYNGIAWIINKINIFKK